MKVFIAGASGAVGRRLIPRLVASRHDVTAMTRSAAKAEELRGLGAEVAVAGGWNYARTGTGLKVEDDPFDPEPPAPQGQSLQAFRQLEATVPAPPSSCASARYP